jgi:hypothetical protein
MGTQLREAESGLRYTPTTTFETFPFPWTIGKEPTHTTALNKTVLHRAKRWHTRTFRKVIQQRTHHLGSKARRDVRSQHKRPSCHLQRSLAKKLVVKRYPSMHVQAIAHAAQVLVEQRDAWLNAPNLSASDRQKRTLTHLYNQRPDWLTQAHEHLDRAVLAAYGLPHTIGDEDLLAHLLMLNQARANR